MRYRMGEALHLPPELEAVARSVQEDHRTRHPWEGLIADYLDEEIPDDWMKWELKERQSWHNGGMHYEGELVPRDRICAAEIWCEALGKLRGDMRQRDTREINSLLERMQGWHDVGQARGGKPYGVQRCFERNRVEDTPLKC